MEMVGNVPGEEADKGIGCEVKQMCELYVDETSMNFCPDAHTRDTQ